MILLKSEPLKVAKINKTTKAKFFKDLQVGDEICLSIPVKAAGGSSATYASYITVTNMKSSERVQKSFNEISPILAYFEFEPV